MPISLFLLPPPPPPFYHRRTAVVSPKFRPTSSAIFPPRLRRKAAAPRCASQGGWEGSAAERETEEWVKLGRMEENCRGDSAVEMLECLEREAIMGEDEGRDPNDYNRRAKIFNTSSRVFQALKQHQQQQHHSEDEHEEEDKDEHVHI